MALYGGSRDAAFLRGINNEFIKNIVSQEVLYYKINSEFTDSNVYGESLSKFYNEPVLMNLLVMRDDQQNINKPFGPDDTKLSEFRFFKPHLVEANLYCEKGDIIEWQKEFYEVERIVENQYFVGKSENTFIDRTLENFGQSVSVNLTAKLIRPDQLNIVDVR